MSDLPALLAGIYPIADDDPRWRHGPRRVVEAALAGGARVLQLRLKHTDDGPALELLQWALERARAAGALLVVNDRYDLADLAGAGAVHVGEHDLPPERIPEPVRARLSVGLSTHTLEQVRASRQRPIDYIGFGPVFGTSSVDAGYDERGIEMLREAVTLAGHPVVAIGGIDERNVALVARAGAAAAAVISAIANADDPETATRQLAARFLESR